MRRSAGTVRLASSASRASSARGFRPPSRTGVDPSRTSNGPRRSVTMAMVGDATPGRERWTWRSAAPWTGGLPPGAWLRTGAQDTPFRRAPSPTARCSTLLSGAHVKTAIVALFAPRRARCGAYRAASLHCRRTRSATSGSLSFAIMPRSDNRPRSLLNSIGSAPYTTTAARLTSFWTSSSVALTALTERRDTASHAAGYQHHPGTTGGWPGVRVRPRAASRVHQRRNRRLLRLDCVAEHEAPATLRGPS
jgi:hypothetical protein